MHRGAFRVIRAPIVAFSVLSGFAVIWIMPDCWLRRSSVCEKPVPHDYGVLSRCGSDCSKKRRPVHRVRAMHGSISSILPTFLVPQLEENLRVKRAGDRFTVDLPPRIALGQDCDSKAAGLRVMGIACAFVFGCVSQQSINGEF